MLLLAHDQMCAPVQLPAFFIMLFAEIPLLAIGDGIDTASVDSLADQEIFRRIGASVTQRQIVFFGTPFIAITFNGNPDSGAFL